MDLTSTVWTLLPPVIAIALALITKEVYSSLLIGILSGALLLTGFNPLHAVETTFEVMGSKLGDNIEICIFLVLLGILVSLVTKSGASRAYGNWAVKTIRTRRGAAFATSFLGVFIFIDDYFNCLTVGSVMRPVTDRYKVSRAKLAYIIDSTAAPVCIIAPISSWAAAVGSSLPESSSMDGFSLFLQTIPMNLYALLTLMFLIWLMAADFDFGPMGKYEAEHKKDELSSVEENHVVGGTGKVYDLILPICVLIVLCISAMLYTGGILEGANIIDAFANCSSSTSLVLGSFFTLIFTFLLYIPRKILTFSQFCEAFTEGFKAMVPAIMILTLAWTLSGVCSEDYLNIGGYVSSIVNGDSMVSVLMPAIFFLIALGLAFATGTSWGTFTILLPIVIPVFSGGIPAADLTSELINGNDMLMIAIAATLGGAVMGDHCSPISDTTIMASSGAQCYHLNHVATQLPYAMTVAVVCFANYILASFIQNVVINLAIAIVCMVVVLLVIGKLNHSMNRHSQRD